MYIAAAFLLEISLNKLINEIISTLLFQNHIFEVATLANGPLQAYYLIKECVRLHDMRSSTALYTAFSWVLVYWGKGFWDVDTFVMGLLNVLFPKGSNVGEISKALSAT